MAAPSSLAANPRCTRSLSAARKLEVFPAAQSSLVPWQERTTKSRSAFATDRRRLQRGNSTNFVRPHEIDSRSYFSLYGEPQHGLEENVRENPARREPAGRRAGGTQRRSSTFADYQKDSDKPVRMRRPPRSSRTEGLKMRNGLILLWMVLCSIASAAAQVSVGIGFPGVSIGINLPAYPGA